MHLIYDEYIDRFLPFSVLKAAGKIARSRLHPGVHLPATASPFSGSSVIIPIVSSFATTTATPLLFLFVRFLLLLLRADGHDGSRGLVQRLIEHRHGARQHVHRANGTQSVPYFIGNERGGVERQTSNPDGPCTTDKGQRRE